MRASVNDVAPAASNHAHTMSPDGVVRKGSSRSPHFTDAVTSIGAAITAPVGE